MFLCKNLQLLQWNSQKHIYIYDVCLERNLPLLNKVRLIKLLNATSVTIMNHLMEVASTFGAELSGRTAKYITV